MHYDYACDAGAEVRLDRAQCLGASFAPVAMAAYPAAPRLSAEQVIVYYGVASADGEARSPNILFHQQ